MWFVLLVLWLCIAIGGFVAISMGERAGGWIAIVGSTVVFVMLSIFLSTDTISNGHIGIVKQFGSLVGTTGEGLVTHAPWQSVDPVSVKNELATYEMNDKTNSAVSRDSQPVYMVVQVNYSLRKGKAVDIYKETGGDFKTVILDPAVFQDVKEVTAQYQATQFAANRERIRQKIEHKLSHEVRKHGLTINNVALKNVEFTDALTQAIEQTVEARQQALRAQAQVQIKEAEADQAVAEAKGRANSQVAEANGYATATKTKASADAFANRAKARTLNPLLIQQAAIDKLNPNVKVIICQQRQVCIPQAVISTAGTDVGK